MSAELTAYTRGLWPIYYTALVFLEVINVENADFHPTAYAVIVSKQTVMLKGMSSKNMPRQLTSHTSDQHSELYTSTGISWDVGTCAPLE